MGRRQNIGSFFVSIGLLALSSYCAQGQRVLKPADPYSKVLGGIRFQQRSVPRYEFDPTVTAVALACPYASGRYLNPEAWDSTRRERRILAVELVYSNHPVDTTAWLTTFGRLMAERLVALQALDRRLSDTAWIKQIRWTLVRQTAARSRADAEGLFHGAVIRYATDLSLSDQPGLVARQELELEQVRAILSGGVPLPDSSMLRLVEDHPDWKYEAVVIDWTGSMYAHGASLIRALELRRRLDALGVLVLFNDGDDIIKGALRRKPLGQTGGVLACPNPRDLTDVLNTLGEVMLRGDGGEPAENNIEALLWTQRRYPYRPRILHLADNTSAVRDISLLPQLTTPVDVIACVRADRAWLRVNDDLLAIAWSTGGSYTWGKVRVRFAKPRENGRWTIGSDVFAASEGKLIREH
jgi:hypothetical protein